MSKSIIGAFDEATPAASGWAVVEGEGTSVTTNTSAAKRGPRGLLVTSGSEPGYAYVVPVVIPPGGERIVGAWVQRNNYVGINYGVLDYALSGTVLNLVCFNTAGAHAGEFWLYVLEDGGDDSFNVYGGSHVPGTWYWITLHVKRATGGGVANGSVSLYVNGSLAANVPAVKNWAFTGLINRLRVGLPTGNGRRVYVDDVVVCDVADLGGLDTLTPPPWHAARIIGNGIIPTQM